MTRQNHTANKIIISLSKCIFFSLKETNKQTKNTKIKHIHYGLKAVIGQGKF